MRLVEQPYTQPQIGVPQRKIAGLCRTSDSVAWSAPPTLANPNILLIIVDQMRWPQWLKSSQTQALQSMLPNIWGTLRNRSYVFGQYYTAATACGPCPGYVANWIVCPPERCLCHGYGQPDGAVSDSESSLSNLGQRDTDTEYRVWQQRLVVWKMAPFCLQQLYTSATL